MRAKDLMVPEIFVVGADDSIATAKNLFLKRRISRLLVVDGDDVVGILSEGALTEAFLKARDPVDTVPVSKVMRKTITTVKPNTPVSEIARKILKSRGGCVVVEDQGAVGIITKTDLIRFFARQMPGRWKVGDVMSKKVRTVSPTHSMFRAARDMVEHSISRLVVVETKPVGIVTSRDIALASFGMLPTWLVMHRQKGQKRAVRHMPLTVADVMQTDMATIPSKSDAVSAAKLMLEKEIGSVVVVDRGKLVGIVTQTDLVNRLAKA